MSTVSDGHHLAPGILIVDDEPFLLALLKTVLGREGFQVYACSSGRAAIDTFRRHSDDIRVVLLDVTMPGLDGVQTLAELRQLDPGVRACFMSGHSQRYTVEELLAQGAQRFYEKPFQIQALAEGLRTLACGATRRSA
ncbi:MAG: response regulator [Gemmataceae bacterium]